MPDAKHQPQLESNHKLHALCPYFAMFPPAFARENILKHTRPGDLILDPFSGRGTTLLEALLNDRDAIACDVNPVAYCVSAAKAHTPDLDEIIDEIDDLEDVYPDVAHRFDPKRLDMPAFFGRAFHSDTLRQILFLRSVLAWRRNPRHRFVAALVLGHLHGESGRSAHYLSNQMPHTIATKPDYSLQYWRENGLWAPKRNAFELLRDRAEFRLKYGWPERQGRAVWGDARRAARMLKDYRAKVSAVITSPPYFDVTSFEEDQWLRIWFLGGPARPAYGRVSTDDRHRDQSQYWKFLSAAWKGIRPLVKTSGVLVCRIGSRALAVEQVIEKLKATVRTEWPKARLVSSPTVSYLKNRQAAILHPKSVGCRYELDCSFSLN
jgi:hypothetical protein